MIQTKPSCGHTCKAKNYHSKQGKKDLEKRLAAEGESLMRITINPDPYWSLFQLQIIQLIRYAKYIVLIASRQQGKTDLGSKILSHLLLKR